MGPPKPIIDITPEQAKAGYRPSRSGAHLTPPSPPRRFISRRFRTMVVILSFVFLAGLIWYWMQPRVYRATGTMLVSRMGIILAPVTEAEMESEAEIVRSQAVELALGTGTSPRIAESIETSDARREAIRQRIRVEVAGKSQVLRVSYTDPSQRESLASANLLMELYLQHRFRLFSTPMHLVTADVESAALNTKAEQTARELQNFDRASNGATAVEEYRARSRRRASLESRAVDLKAAIRGQAEMLRILRARADEAESLKAEVQLAGMRAQLQELESELARVEKSDARIGYVVSERDELKRRAERATEQSEYLTRKLQEARFGGSPLQARILTRAESTLLPPFDLNWWKLALLCAAALAIAFTGALIVDSIDRPVYSEEDLARVSGAPNVRARSTSAGE